MYSSQQLIAGIQKEYAILAHLGSKVNEEIKNSRLTEAQRTIEELEQYIVSSLPAQVKLMVAGNWDQDLYQSFAKKFEGFSYDQFDSALSTGLDSIVQDIQSLTDDQWSAEVSLWGRTGPRSMFLVDYVFTFLGGYKMQLFLQLKHAGLTDLGTMNVWAGMDQPKH